MRLRAERIRKHLTYANVMATIAAFVVLTGGAAIAAGQLGKNSVGKKQLKANSVTTAKLKKNAITTAKIKSSAVTGAKVKGASLADGKLSATVPFTRIVQEIRAKTVVALTSEAGPKYVPYPIDGTYTQEAGRSDSYVGYVDATIAPACVGRELIAFLMVDPKDATELSQVDIGSVAALGAIQEAGSAAVSRRINLGPYPAGGTRIGPATATSRHLVIGLKGKCGAGEGMTVTGAGIDVIGTR